MDRYLRKCIETDLQKKMVFLGGPRQAGKTTLAKALLSERRGSYFNWDKDEDRSRILENDISWSGLVVLDEIHKYRRWRNWIKGIFDTKTPSTKILVTGSARLDLYRFGGDSLQGRYHYLRLHPLSVSELSLKSMAEIRSLLELGGFPEPFLSQSQIEAKRWSREYRSRLVREDLVSLERVDDLATLEKMIIRLPELVGSPLSINNLREDLQISHKTAARWLEIFERLYAIFRISPMGGPKIRAVKKEQKHYHLDWSLVRDEGARFENMVACHLLKWVHYQEDTRGLDMELRYFRDTDGREVDFVLIAEGRITHLIECKTRMENASSHLIYLKRKYPQARALQVHLEGSGRKTTSDGIELISALEWLKELV